MAGSATPRAHPLRDRDFRLVWWGFSASACGSGIALVALPVTVYSMTGSPGLTALLVTVEAAPYLLFGLVTGAITDRTRRLRVMITCDVVSALGMASIPAAQAVGALTVGHVFVAAFLVGTAFVFFDSARFGVITSIVGRPRIPSAMSALSASETVLGVLAPALGGVLIAALDPARVLWVDAASYGVSALVLSRVRDPGSGGPRPPRSGQVLRDVMDGLRHIGHSPVIRSLTALGFLVNIAAGAVVGLLVGFAIERLGVAGPQDARMGLLYSAGSVGALLAATALPRLVARFSPTRMFVAVLPLHAAALLWLAWTASVAAGLVAILLWWATWVLTNLNAITIRQQLTPPHLQGRVNTSARTISYAGQPLGALAAAALTSTLSVQLTYACGALVVAGAAVLGWCSPLRRIDLDAFRRSVAAAE